MRFVKDEIKKIAGDDVVYYRGARYFREGAVSNVTWSKTNKRYRSIVQGKNPYTVTIVEEKSGEPVCSCNCPDFIKSKKPCKHIIATMLFVSDYIERKEEDKRSPEEKQSYDILEYFGRQDFKEVYGDVYDIKLCIAVPAIFKGNTGKAFLSIQAGNKRLYKVQNLKKFLSDYFNKENITLGKEFRFIVGESRFSKRSQKILDYLLEIYEVQESLGRAYYSNIFTKSEMTITRHMLCNLLKCVGKESFQLVLKENTFENALFCSGNPDIRFHISVKDDVLALDYENEYQIIPLADDGSLLLCDGILYKPEENFLRNYLPFYNTLWKASEPLKFKGEDKNRFLDLVLPKLHETMKLQIPESMKSRYIDEAFRGKVYLDREKNNIQAGVYFEYGSYKINPLKPDIPDGVILIRKKGEEEKLISFLEDCGFMPHKEHFFLKEETDIYQFITQNLQTLTEEYDCYYSDAFHTLSVNPPGAFRAAVRLKEDSRLLEMDLSFEGVPREELKDIFHSLQLKKKYHRLKNGSFIYLESQETKSGLKLLNSLDLDYKNQEGESFLIPEYTAAYLNQYMEEHEEMVFIKDKGFEALIDEITGNQKKSYRVPGKIQADLRDYQKKGYEWLRMLADHSLGGVLADDMGLGKTLESIVYIVSNPGRKALIVCPTSLVYNWQDECASFAPHLRTVVVCGAPEARKELITGSGDADVIITSYPLIRRDYELYKELDIHTMFLDEAQFIKNPGSQNAKAVKKIAAEHKFALTGTPIENSLTELWSIFDFVMPGFLSSYHRFVENYERPIIRDEDSDTLKELIRRIQPFVLRRMKKDVLGELPDKIETKLLTEMTEEQNKVYLSYMDHIKAELSNAIKTNGFEKSSFQILSALTRLRQICCHPATFVENYAGDSGKLELLMEQLPVILESGHRVLIFSQFTSMLKIIAQRLDEKEISYFYLDGATKTEERRGMVERFNNGEKELFLISLKAGGTGLNLVGADTVIHYDPWWNPAVEEQATDRVYRIGQTNTVHVIKLLTKGTIEEKIYKLQKQKKELSEAVISAKEVFINKLTREEIEGLFL